MSGWKKGREGICAGGNLSVILMFKRLIAVFLFP